MENLSLGNLSYKSILQIFKMIHLFKIRSFHSSHLCLPSSYFFRKFGKLDVSLFVKLMLQNSSATFFYIFLNKFFSGKNQELGKGQFFKIKPEIKPTTPITSSTGAMKMKFYDTRKIFVEQNCRKTESVSLAGLGLPV